MDRRILNAPRSLISKHVERFGPLLVFNSQCPRGMLGSFNKGEAPSHGSTKESSINTGWLGRDWPVLMLFRDGLELMSRLSARHDQTSSKWY